MLSKEGAAKFTELTAAPYVVTGAGEGLKLTPAAASASALVKAGGDNNWNYYFFVWYSPMGRKIQTAVGELAAGRVTADEFTTAARRRPTKQGPADQEAHAQLAGEVRHPAGEGVRCDTAGTVHRGVLVLPLALYAVFVISPFIQAFYYSLTNWTGVSPTFDFIGLGTSRT